LFFKRKRGARRITITAKREEGIMGVGEQIKNKGGLPGGARGTFERKGEKT